MRGLLTLLMFCKAGQAGRGHSDQALWWGKIAPLLGATSVNAAGSDACFLGSKLSEPSSLVLVICYWGPPLFHVILYRSPKPKSLLSSSLACPFKHYET